MPEPSLPPGGLPSETFHEQKIDQNDRHEEELGDPVSGEDGIGLPSVIGQNDPDLPMVVRIDHTDTLGHPDPVF